MSDDGPYDHCSQWNELKQASLERILGPMDTIVGHALIPFDVGGPTDMYSFPDSPHGIAFATMELIEPDQECPLPNEIGQYEFVAFTRHNLDRDQPDSPFSKMEN